MPEDTTPYALRLPAELMEHVRERAQHDGRSINAEITWLLTQALNMSRLETGRMELAQQVDEAGGVSAWMQKMFDQLGITVVETPEGAVPVKRDPAGEIGSTP